MAVRENVTITYRGARYEFGHGQNFYGIWAIGAPGPQPLNRRWSPVECFLTEAFWVHHHGGFYRRRVLGTSVAPTSVRALSKTWNNILLVSLPVLVFCSEGWKLAIR